MSGDTPFAFDEVNPIEIGYLPDELGIIFPSDHGFSFRTQTGGVCCHQLTGAGTYLSIGDVKMNRRFPDWYPDNEGGTTLGNLDPDEISPENYEDIAQQLKDRLDVPNPRIDADPASVPSESPETVAEWVAEHKEKHPITQVDLETIPEDDYETLPEWVKERDPVQFYNWNEFSYWLDGDSADDAWWYGWTNLVKELRRWNYCPDGSMNHAHDMTREWDGLEEIWAAIDECLSFTYEEYDYHAEKMQALQNDEELEPPLDDERLPGPCEGIKWITLTGSKTDRDGNIRTPWAEELAGETVLLSYPNCD